MSTHKVRGCLCQMTHSRAEQGSEASQAGRAQASKTS